jgi:PBP1b-binding outer membrane lipoprotein LpoB
MRAPILLLALLLSACANPLKAANPVAQVKPGVQSEAKNPTAVTEQKPPVPLPDIPPSKKRDHNIEED